MPTDRQTTRKTDTKIDIGLAEDQRCGIAGILTRVLAHDYCLYTKTQHDYWNAVGLQCRALHLCLEDQYKQLSDSVDEVTERLCTLVAALWGRWQSASITPGFATIRGNIRRHGICPPVSEWTMRR